MVVRAATHPHDLALELAHEYAHELAHEHAPAPVSAPARVGVGKYVTINYTLRTNGAIRHIRSAVWGDEPLEYLHGGGRLLPALERALEGKAEGERFVVVDTNHPLAGMTLEFEVTVVGVRDAPATGGCANPN